VTFGSSHSPRKQVQWEKIYSQRGALIVPGLTSCGGLAILRTMEIDKMLAELRTERDHIDEAILIFERLAAGRGRRRGRPPAWMTTLTTPAVKRRGRPPGSKNKPKAS
jgi:hypothetical protein